MDRWILQWGVWGDKVLPCVAGRWGERWRRSATCRSALRTSLASEHLLSESWRQHCGALSAPSPTEAPVHAKQAQAALSPWPRFIHLPATFPLGNKRLFILPPDWARVCIQFNFQPSNVLCNGDNAETSRTVLGEGALQGQRAIKKKKILYCWFLFQAAFATWRA